MMKLPGSASLGLMNQSRALAILTYTVLAIAVFAGLYWAQSVLIPLALGILFTTIAAPVVKYIERAGLSRVPAVVAFTVVVVALGAGLGWLIFAQATQLVVDIPTYHENIIDKAETLRSLTHSQSRVGWDRLLQRLQQSAANDQMADSATAETLPEGPAPPPAAAPAGDPFWWPAVTIGFGLMAQVMGYVALAAVVGIFLLVDREDARNRIIQLVGRGQITQTTKALDDATRRISRFLLMQAMINGSYGVVLAIALSLLGVNYAILWGVLAAVLRYIPYIGGSIATVFPVTLALAQFPQWWPALVIVGIVLVQELIVNNFVEPRLFGHSIGVSSVALIMAAAFWTFLWGPVGLIMAGPLTVCLVVMSKYVPQLRFLNVLLGDKSPMEKEVILYQRLLAKDEIETERIMEDELESHSLPVVYDTLVFPAAANAGMDRENGLLSTDDEEYVYNSLDEIMASAATPHANPTPNESVRVVRLLLVAARDRGDRMGVAALANTLPPSKYQLVHASEKLIATEIIALAEEEEVDGICISSLPPGGLSHSKYLCKRLRTKLPQLKVFVGHWSGAAGDAAHGWSGLDADVVVHSVQEMLRQLEAWKPVLDTSPQAVQRNDELVASG